MSTLLLDSFKIPHREAIAGKRVFVSQVWETFFRKVYELLKPLGEEKSFPIVNNQAAAADVIGMQFKKGNVSQVVVDWLVQRVTTSTGAVETIESGIFILVYNPTSENWSLVGIGTPGPDDSGVDFTVTSGGQVQYASTNIAGTASISKLTWRARTMAAKHRSYSVTGTR